MYIKFDIINSTIKPWKFLIYINVKFSVSFVYNLYYQSVTKNSIILNMTATFLPAILVPLVGLVFPAISMALFFIYIQTDDIS